MTDISESYKNIMADILPHNTNQASSNKKNDKMLQLVAASKGQDANKIEKLLKTGHRVFGENKVQETNNKWGELRKNYPDIELHLIGNLQSNKAAEAVAIFDVIETIDRPKIAFTICEEMKKQGKTPACLIQVNIGDEAQKSGVEPKELGALLNYCSEIGLDIKGLMCVPPNDKPPAPYFALLQKLVRQYGLSDLSMGMSQDYKSAMKFGATYIRVGTALFGERDF